MSDYKTIDKVYDELRVPLILQNRGIPAMILFEVFKLRGNYIQVKCTSKQWYYLIKTKEKNQDRIDFAPLNYEVFNFDSSQICAYPGLWLDRPFNSNNNIVKYYLSQKTRINKNSQLSAFFDEFFFSVHDFMYDIHSRSAKWESPGHEIKYINSFLVKINQVEGTDFKLSPPDFSTWINSRIKWENVS